MAKFTDNLIDAGLTCLGLILMVSPLALWIAWTEAILVLVLMAALAAGVLYCILIRFEKPAMPTHRKSYDVRRPENFPGNLTDTLPENLTRELHGLHPFIHHHRPTRMGPKFQAAMDRLKRYLYC